MIQSPENQEISVKLKNGGLNGRRPSNGQDTCSGPASDLVGGRRGLALVKRTLILRMDRLLE
jgi:hypothetical protein